MWDSIIKTRNVPPESLNGYKEMMIGDVVKGPRNSIIKWWAQRQSYIAMGFLMQTAALLKVDTCPMEGLDPEKYDEILGVKNSEYATVAAVALGYRHLEDSYQKNKKVRFSRSEIIEFK